MGAKIYELEQAVEDFLVAKQAEGKSNAALSFYRGNLGRIL
jgi:hypothetical protein